MSQRTLEPGKKDPQVQNKREKAKKEKDREIPLWKNTYNFFIILLSKQKSGDTLQVIKQPTLYMNI